MQLAINSGIRRTRLEQYQSQSNNNNPLDAKNLHSSEEIKENIDDEVAKEDEEDGDLQSLSNRHHNNADETNNNNIVQPSIVQHDIIRAPPS